MAEQQQQTSDSNSPAQYHLSSVVSPYPHNSSTTLQSVLTRFERLRMEPSTSTPLTVGSLTYSPTTYPSTPTMDKAQLLAADDCSVYLYPGMNSNSSPASSLLSSPSSGYSPTTSRLRTSTYPSSSSPLYTLPADYYDTTDLSPLPPPQPNFYTHHLSQPPTPILFTSSSTPGTDSAMPSSSSSAFLAAPPCPATTGWAFNDRHQLVDPYGVAYEIASPLLMAQNVPDTSGPTPTTSQSGPPGFRADSRRRETFPSVPRALTPSVSAPTIGTRRTVGEDVERIMKMQPGEEPPRRTRRGMEIGFGPEQMEGLAGQHQQQNHQRQQQNHQHQQPQQQQQQQQQQGKKGEGEKDEVGKEKKTRLYKTELCRSWEEKGECRYGRKCQYAHGEAELRPVYRHKKYKTQICRTFWETGTCPYGVRCTFIHRDDSKANKNIIFVEDLAKEREKNERVGRREERRTNGASEGPSRDTSQDPFDLTSDRPSVSCDNRQSGSDDSTGGMEDGISQNFAASTNSSSADSQWSFGSPASPLLKESTLAGTTTSPHHSHVSPTLQITPTSASAAEEQDAFLAMLSEALNAPAAPAPADMDYTASVSTLAAATGLDHRTIADLYFAGQLEHHLAGLTADENTDAAGLSAASLFESLTARPAPSTTAATVTTADALSQHLLPGDLLHSLIESPPLQSHHTRRASEIAAAAAAAAEAQREAAGQRRRTRSLNETTSVPFLAPPPSLGRTAASKKTEVSDVGTASRKNIVEKRLPVFKNIG
ncbi:hypothetical protein BC937DRAFT_93660 [Endogone sp. FLAS-F59071]|nr:hypothetical protein BC937DRAFT_93660 [Endogone sp. FLAS-F59071]|eukprot:RUS14542.1 hypothetical protein BC937DRAFT_93660 [Endogone sp. FLAS-F59071]